MPARALPHSGLPAYESDHGTILVMENLVVFGGGHSHPPMLLPRSYHDVAVRTNGEGLAALHDDPAAIWSWRPILYKLGAFDTQALGSQQELEYRRGIWDVNLANSEDNDADYEFIGAQLVEIRRRYGRIPPLERRPGETGWRLPKNARKRLHREYLAWASSKPVRERMPFVEARERAEAILYEHLAPQQRLDLARRRAFFVRGRINRLYRVEFGNGFAIVDPVTYQPIVSICLHPDYWMPHADVALATKLAIDAGEETESELLSAARSRPLPRVRPADREERAAHRLEERFRLNP